MQRTLVLETIEKIGQTVLLQGWVNTRRDHGKIVFIDLRDRTGIIQIVMTSQQAGDLHSEDVISLTGLVKSRPEKLINTKILTGAVEIETEKVELISQAAQLPFDMGQDPLDVQLPTLLDYRTLTLRHPRISAIFKIQEAILEGFRHAAKSLGCMEIFTPTISASATEGGTEVFPVDWYGYRTYLVQSPQLYKQMAVPAFERVYMVSHAYRAEPSVTTRHLSEAIQMDCELAFVNFEELLDALEFVGSQTLKYASAAHPEILAKFEVLPPKISAKIPRLTMRQAQQIILDRTGVDHTQEPDLMPEDEREICRWAVEEHDSDLVTITHFPTHKRSFYTLPDPEDPKYSLSFDLLFRGVEILSGSQRVNNYDQLVQVIKERGMNPDNFKMYLQAFKYGMPPEGGFSFGLERLTKQLLELSNVREASLFPRDMERVDFRLSELQPHVKESK